MSIKPVADSQNAAPPGPRPPAPNRAGGPTYAEVAARVSASPPAAAASAARLDAAIEHANRLIGGAAQNLRFRADPASQGAAVKVIDAETGATLRALPAEELYAIGKALERMPGLMLRLKV